jgi:hypothetical protein
MCVGWRLPYVGYTVSHAVRILRPSDPSGRGYAPRIHLDAATPLGSIWTRLRPSDPSGRGYAPRIPLDAATPLGSIWTRLRPSDPSGRGYAPRIPLDAATPLGACRNSLILFSIFHPNDGRKSACSIRTFRRVFSVIPSRFSCDESRL